MPPSIPDHVFYPSSDGKRMAEDMWQFNAILNTYNDIKTVHPGALVAAALLVYPEEGNRDNSISPAVLVAFGIGTENRWHYLVWKEGKPPDWVLEMASASIRAGDREKRRNRYAAMGVPEYWLFDPKGDALPPGAPRLQALGCWTGNTIRSSLECWTASGRSAAKCRDWTCAGKASCFASGTRRKAMTLSIGPKSLPLANAHKPVPNAKRPVRIAPKPALPSWRLH